MLRLTCRPDELFETVTDFFKEDGGALAARTLIVPKTGDVDRWRARLAAERPELAFDMKIETLAGFVGEQWSLFGDGRRFSTPMLERLVMARALKGLGGEGPGVDAGTIDLLCRAASIGLGIPQFDKTLKLHAAGFDGGGAQAWRPLASYAGLLSDLGLVTYGQALCALAGMWDEARRAGAKPPVLAGFDYLLPSEVSYVAAIEASAFLPLGENAPAYARVETLASQLGCRRVSRTGVARRDAGRSDELARLAQRLYREGEVVKPGGSVRFAIGSGEYAEVPLLVRTIAGLIDEGIPAGEIFVASDVLSSSLDLQERLAGIGIASCGRVSCKLTESDLGKAFRWVVERPSVRAMCDFALSPFSGLGRADACRLDERWRARRATTVDSCLEDLHEAGGATAVIVDVARRGDFAAVAQAMAAVYLRHPADALHAALVQATSGKIADLYRSCEAIGGSATDCLALMELLGVSARYRVGGDGAAVTFGTLEELASTRCQAAVITGLTSAAYPVSRDGDQLTALLQGAGVDARDIFLDSMRYRFHQAVCAPSRVLVVERRLADADGKDANPSALLEELVDCYRPDPSNYDDLDRATALPLTFVDGRAGGVPLVVCVGEDGLSEIEPAPAWPEGLHGARKVSPRRASCADARMREEVARLALGDAENPRILSPTYAELYMSCPYKWFVERKLSPEGLDAELDARALGTLTHEVLRRYYEELAAGGAPRRIGEGDLKGLGRAVARLAHESIDALVEADDSSPLAVLTELDKRSVKGRLRDVRNLLADDMRFLPGFVPTYLEYRFGYDEPFEYGGRLLRGTIDRIDVNSNGYAVVIDYKGKLGDEYGAEVDSEDDEPPIPEKIQALIYAQVAQRLLGLDVVGAIYRSYSERGAIRGYYDLMTIGPAELFGYDGALMPEAFYGLIDRTEVRVAEAYRRMEAGDIAPDPIGKETCRYCRARNHCEGRLS